MSYRGESYLDAGYFYAPYISLGVHNEDAERELHEVLLEEIDREIIADLRIAASLNPQFYGQSSFSRKLASDQDPSITRHGL